MIQIPMQPLFYFNIIVLATMGYCALFGSLDAIERNWKQFGIKIVCFLILSAYCQVFGI